MRSARSAPRGAAAVLGAVLSIALAMPAAAEDTVPMPSSTTVVPTHFYDLGVSAYSVPQATPWITRVRGSEMLVLGADAGFLAPEAAGSVPSPSMLGGTTLAYPVGTFDAADGAYRSLGYVDLTPQVGAGSRVRILDFQVFADAPRAPAGRLRAFVSAATFVPRTGCRSMTVFEVLVDRSGQGANRVGRTWFRLPCIVATPATSEGPVLHQSGGRLQFRGAAGTRPDALVVTIGDFQVLAPRVAVRPGVRRLLSSVLVVARGGESTTITTGLRNPQGLASAALDGEVTLVATSHGPRGGDEFVRVMPEADYGWPRYSYGTAYGTAEVQQFSRPGSPGTKGASDRPSFAWLPSVGASTLLQVRPGVFGRWWMHGGRLREGDLLVSGLATRSLYRLRWDDGAVRYVEAIPMSHRIRSLAQADDGTIVAGTDEGLILRIAPA
jgi:hypothetical protein